MEPSGRNPAATGGKWDGRKNGSNRRKPLPWVATGCLRHSMVRRRSIAAHPSSAASDPFTTADGVNLDSG
jgi:hypothetical protein